MEAYFFGLKLAAATTFLEAFKGRSVGRLQGRKGSQSIKAMGSGVASMAVIRAAKDQFFVHSLLDVRHCSVTTRQITFIDLLVFARTFPRQPKQIASAIFVSLC